MKYELRKTEIFDRWIALSRRCGMSRNKIKAFVHTWLNFDISIGLICKSIREVGIACNPVVDELINDLQKDSAVWPT
jgi:hypothetical protein